MSSFIKVLLVLALVVLLLAVGPWLVIWSLNTIFPVLAIQFNIWTWLAVIILGTFFRANVSVNRKD